jgi:uncharacterized protein
MTDISGVMLRRVVALLIALEALAGVAGGLVGMTQPVSAQQFDWGFFSPWSSPPRRREQSSWPWSQQPYWHQPQQPQYEPHREREIDYSRAPPPRKQDTSASKQVVVMGDAMADWLAYGLEEALADTPEIGVIRKNRANSGLVRGESRNAYDWPQAARELLANDQPTFIVMMIGMSDRQPIRERQIRPNPVAAPGVTNSDHPDQAARRQTAEEEAQAASEDTSNSAPDSGRVRVSTYEFRSEQWAAAYAKRVDEMIAVLKGKGVPVFWVGLPTLRGTRSAAEIAFLNELYRDRAGKAGITYVDVWDGFVDENGNFSMQGPDFEGQMRRLRSADGVYFTKAGARKLAHYVEREIQHAMLAERTPATATPAPTEAQTPAVPAEPDAPASRPLTGPVVPLTDLPPAPGGLMGSGPAHGASSDSTATKFLVRGEPLQPAVGRADDFAWPRNEGLPPAPDNGEDKSGPSPADASGSKLEEKSGGTPSERSDVKGMGKSKVKAAEKPEGRPADKGDASQPSATAGAAAGTGSPKAANSGASLAKRAHRAPAPVEQPVQLSPPPAADDALRPPSPIPGR